MLFDQHRPGLSAEPQNVKGAAGGGKRDADPSGVLTHEIINGGRVVRTHRWTFRDVRVSDCLVQEEEVSFHLAWDEVRFR